MKILLIPLVMAAVTTPTPRHSRTAEWLARSCVGEAGWDAADSGECDAIMHVYGKRARLLGWPVERVARRYSAAIKPGAHSRAWVFGLDRSGVKPRGWPRHLRWSAHRERWERTLARADLFLAGRVPDPVPAAEHYGGRMDRHRLDRRVWVRIEGLPYANWFYRQRRGR